MRMTAGAPAPAPAPASARRGTLAVVAVLAVALVAWIVTVDRMRGMDAGPGTDLGGLGWFTGVWATMMAAMMLPSAAPSVKLFSRTARPPSPTSPATESLRSPSATWPATCVC